MPIRENPFKIYIDSFDAEAEAFLRKYKCEDAIINPQPIPIEEIANRYMSLEIIQSECLSLDGSVQGAIAFTKGTVDVYDWKTGEYIGYRVLGPSVFIDSHIINEGRIRNTLAHECFHWWKHRNYFNYKRTHEKSVEFGIRCDRNMPRHNLSDAQWTDIERMEWQARTIAPKILMPRIATRIKIEELYNEIVFKGGCTNQYELVSTVVERLADFFKVSRQSAAIRMIELGYDEAQQYCGDELQSKTKQTRRDSKAERHHQPVSKDAAFRLYFENEFLRETIDTGAFCFADGFFVLRNEKYVARDTNDGFSLTDYAQLHLYECTLDFSIKLIGVPYLIHDSTAHMMYRSDTVFKEKASYESNPQNTELYNKAKEFERRFARSKKYHKTASQMLKDYMEDAHWNTSTFQSITQLDAMTYTRVQNDYKKFTMRPLITMGYCLGLDVAEMEEVLSCAGLAFNPTKLEDQAYKYIFTAFPNRDIEECNVFLKSQGVALLGSQARK